MNVIEQFNQSMQSRIVGQDEAIQAISDAYLRWKVGLAGIDRPVGSFLMMGPTGTGKTLTAETMATILHNDHATMIKVHCAEYRHAHEVARLVGAPPGYIGHKETVPRLSSNRLQEIRSNNCNLAILLFDEIEKAHVALHELLLGITDKGQLALGDGSSVDLRQSIILMTSNVGSRESSKSIGYADTSVDKALSAMRNTFSPEFRNRLTGILTYNPLSTEQLKSVVVLELESFAERLSRIRDVTLVWKDDPIKFILRQNAEPEFGARPIGRIIERLIELPLAHMLIEGTAQPGDTIMLEVRDDALKLNRQTDKQKARTAAK